MKNKALVLGDTHFGVSSDSLIFHEYFAKFYAFLFNYIDQNNIKYIIQEGDLFDKRKIVNFLTLHRAKEMFFNECHKRGIEVFVIAGNHDCTYKNTNEVNSVKLLQESCMTVIDQYPQTVKIGNTTVDFYPWINESNYNQTVELSNNPKSKIAVGHFEFSSFPMHPGTMAETGLDHKLFKNYETVYSGHYHTISTKDNIIYTGTPYELNWSDCEDTKGFWIIDLDNEKTPEFIENPFKLYKKIVYTDSKIDVLVKDMFLKVYVTNRKQKPDFEDFLIYLSSQSPYNIQVIDNEVEKAVQNALGSNKEFKSTNDMIDHVVDEMKLDVDRIKLKGLIKEIYAEAMELAKL